MTFALTAGLKKAQNLTGRGGGLLVLTLCCLGYGLYTTWLREGRGGRKQQFERITALEQAMDAHTTTLKVVRTEWEDYLDRMNKVMGRLNARIRRSGGEKTDEDRPEETTEPQEGARGGTGTHGVLQRMRARGNVLSG